MTAGTGTTPGPSSEAHDRRQRRGLIGLAALFFAPLAVSFFLYYGGDWRPGHRVNHGDLITPARPLPELSLPLARAPTADPPTTSTPTTSTPTVGAPTTGVPTISASTTDSPVADTAAADRTAPDWLKRKWTLLYWGPAACSARCRANLYNTRQVRTALNRDMERVQRVFIAEGECCDWGYLAHDQPDLITVRATADAAPLLALLPTFDGINPEAAERIYLIDPLGNLMMSYAPDAKPKGLLEDLKRLLGLSSVG